MIGIGAALDGAYELTLPGPAALMHGPDSGGFLLRFSCFESLSLGVAKALGGKQRGKPTTRSRSGVKPPLAGGSGGAPPSGPGQDKRAKSVNRQG